MSDIRNFDILTGPLSLGHRLGMQVAMTSHFSLNQPLNWDSLTVDANAGEASAKMGEHYRSWIQRTRRPEKSMDAGQVKFDFL